MADRAGDAEIATIRALASIPQSVKATRTVTYDLMGLRLTKDDICREIVAWIDGGGRVKSTRLHSIPGKLGKPAFEMKPAINGSVVYIKVIIEKNVSGAEMLILSAHRDHS